MKKWEVDAVFESSDEFTPDLFITSLLRSRGLTTQKSIEDFLNPVNPVGLTSSDVGIDAKELAKAIKRILLAIEKKESIVVYADYDADGITAGAIMWETLWELGARVMPYIPHRVDEGYGLSAKGIHNVRELYDPALIITVDHGITAREKVAYAKNLGIDIIVTDHHVKPEKLPECTIVHTTNLAGSGVSWFLAKEVVAASGNEKVKDKPNETVALATIGTVADLVPLVGPNRSIVRYGLMAMKKTKRIGLLALMKDAGIAPETLYPYSVSHALAPRLNAMGRIEHALDALRLLCAKNPEKAELLASQLGLTNKQRQQMTEDHTSHALAALEVIYKAGALKKFLIVSDTSYNQGVIGLVAGKVVEQYYRPTIVLSVGEEFSKASARSVSGFNIIEAIRTASDLLVDAGGHPMAAGFTVLTKNLQALQEKLEKLGEESITDELLTRKLHIDAQVPVGVVTESLWAAIQNLQPFGIGSPEPILSSVGVNLVDIRVIGATKKHLKLTLENESGKRFDAVGFGMAAEFGNLGSGKKINIAYTVDMNEWNGSRKLQLKVKDIQDFV